MCLICCAFYSLILVLGPDASFFKIPHILGGGLRLGQGQPGDRLPGNQPLNSSPQAKNNIKYLLL
jgi:hypothetical protein